MKALIAFIILGLIVLTLTEINERIKAKKSPTNEAEPLKEDECKINEPGQEDCSGCGLIEVCEKEEKKNGR